MNNKRSVLFILVLIIFCSHLVPVLAESEKGRLEIVGVPDDVVAGRYDPDAGIFYADVREIPDALIKVNFDDVQILGYKMEWNTKDNYALFSNDAKLEKDDFELSAQIIEYFGDD